MIADGTSGARIRMEAPTHPSPHPNSALRLHEPDEKCMPGKFISELME